jgi:hypothetical protein
MALIFLVGNRVETALVPRVASGDAAKSKPAAANHTVAFDSFLGVRRTGRNEAAVHAHEGAKQISINAD